MKIAFLKVPKCFISFGSKAFASKNDVIILWFDGTSTAVVEMANGIRSYANYE